MGLGLGLGIGLNATTARGSAAEEPEEPGENLGPELSTAAGGGSWAGPGWTENAGTNALTFLGTGFPRNCANSAGTSPEAGATIRATYDLVSISVGTMSARIGSGVGLTRNAPGSYSEDILTSSTTKPSFFASGASGQTMEVRNWSFRRLMGVELDL